MKGEITVLDTLFANIFSQSFDLAGFFTAVITALVLGAVSSLAYMYKSSYSKGFVVTLATLPAIVAVVIMMVSGSVAAGVAVAGTFSLVRFRSAPGTAKEISAVFLAMATGLACGMGYPAYGVVFTVLMCAVSLIYNATGFGEKKKPELRKTLSVTVPEDLNYGEIFDDIMEKYTSECVMKRVKTTNLGSLNRVTYDIVLKKEKTEKAMIDELRCRNGNLEISIGIQDVNPQDVL